ncbi:hypothetical protein PV325_004466 [Microctonus aethiopoides]|nr:hypothetical protein PV326_011197 [Microctonus aethiopoides]KAK0085755.1 hypothetical protein PV325_004466 [Microctonus aethiopoides]
MRKTKGQATMISSPGVAAAGALGGAANIEACSRPCCMHIYPGSDRSLQYRDQGMKQVITSLIDSST